MADNLDAMFPASEAVDAEPVVDTTPEPVTEQATQEPTPEPAVEQPQVEARNEDRIPIGALLDEREKRKALEQELQTLRQQQPQQPANVPDPYDDPAAYNAHMENRIVQERQALKNEFSYQFAVRDHGKEKVEEARQWALSKAQSDPVFDQQVAAAFQTQTSPVDWIVQQHQRDSLLTDIGDNVDDWFTREAAKRGYAAMSAPVTAMAPAMVAQQPATKPAMPPRSIASDSTPASAPVDGNSMAGLDAIFNKR